jgi:hypothetical protein
MSKKLFILISFVLVLGLVSGVSAQDANHICWWTNAGPDSNLWSDANNWYTADWNDVDETWVKSGANSVPAADDLVCIGRGADWLPYPNEVAELGPIGSCRLDSNAVCYELYIGADLDAPNQPSHLEMTGGSLTIRVNADDWVGLGIGWNGVGSMTVHDGVVDIDYTGTPAEGGNLNIGGYDTGVGTLTQLGGEIYCYHLDCTDADTSEGHLNLYGGTFYTTADVEWTEFWMGYYNESPNSTCDVRDGKAIIKSSAINETGPEQELDWINVWIDEGKIIAFGGTEPRAELFASYDPGTGLTTLQAVATELEQAWHPDPRPGKTVDYTLTLSWSPGDYATSHIVYLGTDKTAVENGTAPNTPTGANSLYAGELEYSTGYYWQVTEVNGGHPNSPWPGLVWDFRTADYLAVDDFDSYVTVEGDLYPVWDDYWTNNTGAEIGIETTLVQGGKSIEYDYANTIKEYGNYVGSRIDSDTTRLVMRSDWAAAGTKGLVLYFYGQAGNSATVNDKMYVQLEDTSSNAGVAIYDGDPDDVQDNTWHEWNIDLSVIDACGVSLADMDQIHLGFGGFYTTGQIEAGGSGTVYFDDIRLYPARCVPEYAATDLTGDCITGYEDVDILARDWLTTDRLGSPSAPDTEPRAWYTLDDSGTPLIAENSGSLGSDADGVLATAPNNPSWVTPGAPNGPNPTGAMDFGGNDYVTIPELNSVVPGGFVTDKLTITAWVKRNGTQGWWTGMVFCTRDVPDDWGLSVVHAGLSFGDEADWLDPPYSLNEVAYHWDNDSEGDEVGWMFRSGLLVPDGLWTFCAVAVEPTEATLYMSDGTTLSSATNYAEHVATRFDDVFYLGRDPRGSWDPYPDPSHTRHLDGQLDDVRIYDYTLGVGKIMYLAGVEGTVYLPQESPANLYPKVGPYGWDPNNVDVINFMDYDVMAADWLVETLWP